RRRCPQRFWLRAGVSRNLPQITSMNEQQRMPVLRSRPVADRTVVVRRQPRGRRARLRIDDGQVLHAARIPDKRDAAAVRRPCRLRRVLNLSQEVDREAAGRNGSLAFGPRASTTARESTKSNQSEKAHRCLELN